MVSCAHLRKRPRSIPHVATCVLALNLSAHVSAGQLLHLTDTRHKPGLDYSEPNTVSVEDLPEGFHSDVDSITIALGGYHSCALEYRPGVDFGGPVRCWGRDDWSQSTPTDEIFVQVSGAIQVIIRTPEIITCIETLR